MAKSERKEESVLALTAATVKLNQRVMKAAAGIKKQHGIDIEAKRKGLFKTHDELSSIHYDDLTLYVAKLCDAVFTIYAALLNKGVVPLSQTIQDLRLREINTPTDLRDVEKANGLLNDLNLSMKKIKNYLNNWVDRRLTKLEQELEMVTRQLSVLSKLVEKNQLISEKVRDVNADATDKQFQLFNKKVSR